MTTDEELFEQMKLQEESPDDPRQRKIVKPKYAKSKFNLKELQAKVGERIWVKCISELGPWADDKQLKHWEDYFIKVEEAIMLDERRFAVILLTQDALKDREPVKQHEEKQGQATLRLSQSNK